MFKFALLSVMLAVAAASPSAVWGAGLATPLATGLATPLAAGWGAPWASVVASPWAAPIATPLAAPVSAVPVGGPAHWVKKRSIVAAAPWATAPLTAGPLAATPLTWGRSWVGPAPVAVAGGAPIAPISPWGLGVGGRVGLW